MGVRLQYELIYGSTSESKPKLFKSVFVNGSSPEGRFETRISPDSGPFHFAGRTQILQQRLISANE
ncbi:hypothetical protein BG842_03530 [Haladaptatus sp. W1]|nr:hypothetical protein BG842_03530 [Haladaptatus sp. W1]